MLTTHGEVEVRKVAELVEDFEEVPAEAMEEANRNLLRLFALTKRLSTAPSEAEAKQVAGGAEGFSLRLCLDVQPGEMAVTSTRR